MTLQGYRPLQARLTALGQTGQMLRTVGLRTVAYAKDDVARKTGTTARTIHLAHVSDTQVVVEAGGAAPFLERGTRPHVIRPTSKKALRWPAKGTPTTLGGRVRASHAGKAGSYAFAKLVRHPGTKPQPFLVPAAKKALALIGITGLVERWNKAA